MYISIAEGKAQTARSKKRALLNERLSLVELYTALGGGWEQ